MSERKINLEEILSNYLIFNRKEDLWVGEALSAMKEACRQVLVLAAENANIKYTDCIIGVCPECLADGVDKESILNTINEVE